MTDSEAYTGDFILDIWVVMKRVDFREKIKKIKQKVKSVENVKRRNSLEFQVTRFQVP